MDIEEDIVAIFAANLRHYRKTKLNMTQEQFAAHCDFDRTYISGLERQTRNPSVRTLQKLAGYLDVEPWELIKPLNGETSSKE